MEPYKTFGCMPECRDCIYLRRGQCAGGCLAHAINSFHALPPKQTKVPINDWIDIGAFSDDDEEELIFRKRVKFYKPEMNIKFIVDTKPARVAIDPLHLLIDRVFDDNTKAVVLVD